MIPLKGENGTKDNYMGGIYYRQHNKYVLLYTLTYNVNAIPVEILTPLMRQYI